MTSWKRLLAVQYNRSVLWITSRRATSGAGGGFLRSLFAGMRFWRQADSLATALTGRMRTWRCGWVWRPVLSRLLLPRHLRIVNIRGAQSRTWNARLRALGRRSERRRRGIIREE